jgi:MFS family permease
MEKPPVQKRRIPKPWFSFVLIMALFTLAIGSILNIWLTSRMHLLIFLVLLPITAILSNALLGIIGNLKAAKEKNDQQLKTGIGLSMLFVAIGVALLVIKYYIPYLFSCPSGISCEAPIRFSEIVLITGLMAVLVVPFLLPSLVWMVIVFIVIPAKNRKIVAMLSAIMLGIYLFYCLSCLCQWRWDLREVSGAVSGVMGFGLTLYDRIVARKRVEAQR